MSERPEKRREIRAQRKAAKKAAKKVQKVKLRIDCRPQFKSFLESKLRWFTLVAHRRAGKTVAVIQKIVKEATTTKRPGPPLRYGYIAPTRDQAKDIAWNYLKDFTAKIPGTVVNEAELRITLPNKAQIRLYSGENYERMRGLYFDGIVSDEDADINPNAFEYVIFPCLLDYEGWHVRIGTPKGKNAFYKAHRRAVEEPDHFSLLLKASESGILSEANRKEYLKQTSQDAYDQEMECDFNVGRPGAIYADEVSEAIHAPTPRVFPFQPDPEVPVFTTWDLGAPENTVVVYWQRVGFQHRVIDCDHYGNMHKPNGDLIKTTAERVSHMKAKGYNYGGHFVPHDAKKVDTDGLSFEVKLRKAGLSQVRSIPREPHRAEEKRIRAMKDIFSTIYFNEDTCSGEGGLTEALENYHRKINSKTNKVTNEIEHDWTSHFADAFGYYAEASKHGFIKVQDHGPRPVAAETPIRTGDRATRRNRPTSAIM